jgi:hypothetical protein
MIFIYTCSLILALGHFLNWWVVPLLAGIVAFWRLRRLWRALPQAFLAGALGWMVPAIWKDAANGSLLSTKVSQLFHLPGAWGVLVSTALVGGVLAGLGAIMGQRLRKIFSKWNEN